MDIALRSIESDWSSRGTTSSQIDKELIDSLKKEMERLRFELIENESLIGGLKAKESNYVEEIRRLKSMLDKKVDKSESENMDENEYTDTDFYVNTAANANKTDIEKEILFNIDLEIVELNNELNKSTVNKALCIQDDSVFKEKYAELYEAVENLTHPSFDELQNELNQRFYEEYEELKNEYAQKLENELQHYKVIRAVRLNTHWKICEFKIWNFISFEKSINEQKMQALVAENKVIVHRYRSSLIASLRLNLIHDFLTSILFWWI